MTMKKDRFDEKLDAALKVEPVGAALTGRVLANVRARADAAPFFLKMPKPVLAFGIGAFAASFALLGFYAGNLDLGLFEPAAGELSSLIFDDAGSVLEVL